MAFLGVSALSGVLAAGLLVPVAAAAGTGASASVDFFEQLPAELERAPLAQPTKMLASDGSLIATLYEENRQPVTLDKISENMTDAITAIEDNRFYEHGGVDMEGIIAAAASNISSDTTRGASTLTQQYVTNVLLNAGVGQMSGSKTIGDKLREAKLAIAVEKKMSKDEILAGYLNLVPFTGSVFGIQAASKYFFNVDAKDLTVAQSALLAGVVNGPSYYSPEANPERALERRNLVIASMLKYDKITQEEYDAAVKTDLGLNITPLPAGCYGAVQADYFCQYVANKILNDPTYGETREQRQATLFRGGLTIKTTLNSKIQKAAKTSVMETASAAESSPGVGHSMVTVEPGTGNILAMAQNTKLNPGKDKANSVFNFSVDLYEGGDPSKPLDGIGGFQPGSTFKPFTVAAWLDAGKALNDVVDGSKTTYPVGDTWEASCLPGGQYVVGPEDYTPQNYNDENYGNYTVLKGLAQSYNTVTMATAKQVDLCRIFEIAFLTGAHPSKSSEGELKKFDVRPAGLIGAEEVTPLSMATSFATFAAEGLQCDPRAITSVTAVDGREFEVPGTDCEQVIPEELARGVNYATQEVMKSGSGALLNMGGVPTAGKSGTNDPRSQTWFMTYTSSMSTASWLGNWKSNSTSLSNSSIGGQVYPEIDGSFIAGPSLASMMQKVAGILPAEPFQDPPSDMLYSARPVERNVPIIAPPGDDGGGDNGGGGDDDGGREIGPPADRPGPPRDNDNNDD